MTRANLKELETRELVDRYISLLLQQYAVRDHHDAQGRPDMRPWNRLADRIAAIHREIKSRGKEGIDALLPLIHHSNPNVRYAGVVQCLRQRTSVVLPVLEEMARTNDYFETKADFEGALRMWSEGKWVVD
jgi:hypothetical protein